MIKNANFTRKIENRTETEQARHSLFQRKLRHGLSAVDVGYHSRGDGHGGAPVLHVLGHEHDSEEDYRLVEDLASWKPSVAIAQHPRHVARNDRYGDLDDEEENAEDENANHQRYDSNGQRKWRTIPRLLTLNGHDGLKKEDLIPEVDDIIGATTYLDLASEDAITLFV
jgi:hypothetical protein